MVQCGDNSNRPLGVTHKRASLHIQLLVTCSPDPPTNQSTNDPSFYFQMNSNVLHQLHFLYPPTLLILLTHFFPPPSTPPHPSLNPLLHKYHSFTLQPPRLPHQSTAQTNNSPTTQTANRQPNQPITATDSPLPLLYIDIFHRPLYSTPTAAHRLTSTFPLSMMRCPLRGACSPLELPTRCDFSSFTHFSYTAPKQLQLQ